MQRTVFGIPVSKKQVREMVRPAGKAFEVEQLPVNIVTVGHGVPPERYPRKCLTCRLPIGAADRWEASDNGEYVVIRHVSCI